MPARDPRSTTFPAVALALVLAAAAPVGAQRAALAPGGVHPAAVAAAPDVALDAAAAAVRAGPFAGRWTLNVAESAFGASLAAPTAMAMRVNPTGRGALRVHVAKALPGFEPVRTDFDYPLDGRVAPAALRFGERGAARLAFAGDTLVLTRELRRGDLAATVTDRWFLAGGGARLAVARTVVVDGDETGEFLVFDRRR